MFKNPKLMTKAPDAITRRQKGRPSDVWLVAGLLRFPRTLTPIMIMARPSVKSPWEGLRRGQCVWKYEGKRLASEIMRETVVVRRGVVCRRKGGDTYC